MGYGLYTFLTAILGTIVLGSVLYLLRLLVAASRRSVSPGSLDRGRAPLKLVVLVPAHNEELILAQTLDSLVRQDYPAECFEIVVVADNCTDSTAALARACAVTVWERTNDQARGKGYALNWALAQLLTRPAPADAFVIVDADTFAAPDFLSRMAARLQTEQDAPGLCALQGRYGVLNSDEGWRAALMAAAFDLVNHVRPLGRDHLGLSVGLKGNGMAFSRETLVRAHWRGDSLTEDLDFALDLARHHDLRVGYVPEARVWAQMPTSARQATSQRQRWEQGRYRLVRERAWPLLREGLTRRRRLLVDAAIDLLLPPLAELGLLTTVWLGMVGFGTAYHLLPHPILWIDAGVLSLAGLVIYVLGGLRAARASRDAYLALLRAPFYAVWKLALYASGRRSRGVSAAGEAEWVRTARTSISSSTLPPAASSPPEVPVP